MPTSRTFRRTRRSTDPATVQLGGFLRVPQTLLTIGAATLAISVLGVHDLPAAAVPVEQAETARGVDHRDDFRVASYVEGTEVEVDTYAAEEHDSVMWPMNPSAEISAYFGHRDSTCADCTSGHQGVDFLPGVNTPVVAIADGVVSEVGNPEGALGVHVVIDHVIDGDEVSSVYGHMALGSVSLQVGDEVSRGQIVGLVGSTGMSTGPHLHLGILRNDKPIEPLAWMRQHVNS